MFKQLLEQQLLPSHSFSFFLFLAHNRRFSTFYNENLFGNTRVFREKKQKVMRGSESYETEQLSVDFETKQQRVEIILSNRRLFF
jgi:lysine/ornithine N-monooxygenase